MKISRRLQNQIPNVSGVIPQNADLVLVRIGIQYESSAPGADKASVGRLGYFFNGVSWDGSNWPCVENVKYNWLRKGPYKVRMYKRKNNILKNNILQIAAPWWGQHLIHPTRQWQSLRGCISVGEDYDYDKMKLVDSRSAHCELMEELGIFELHKEFTLFVMNNPMDKNLSARQQDWYKKKLRKKIRKMRIRAAKRRSH